MTWGFGLLGFRVCVLCMCVGVSGCSMGMYFPVGETSQARLAEERHFDIVRVTQETIGSLSHAVSVYYSGARAGNPPSGPQSYAYRVGVGDVLQIGVWDNPERRTLSTAGDNIAIVQSGVPPVGIVVAADGKFFYPFVGEVQASGRTVTEIRRDLSQRLRQFIADPQVEVSVEAFNARRATVTGAVEEAGSLPITNLPVRLIDVINRAVVLEQANLSAVELRRGGKTHVVNVRAFLDKADTRQNPLILPDDLVYVPPLEDNKVFVFGEIDVGEIALEKDGLTLLEALAQSGGFDQTRADARGVFVFRAQDHKAARFTVYQLDLQVATALMLARRFELHPLDVVFVTTDPATRWNDTAAKILAPVRTTVQAQALAEALADS